MMKHLRLYPLIFAAIIALILICAVRIGMGLMELQANRIPADAHLVWEVSHYAQA